MEKYRIENDILVFGLQVKTFPSGIGEAFDQLIRLLPGGFGRSCYGISFLNNNGTMVYIAAAIEVIDGEAEKYGCERYLIEKGEYLIEPIRNWREKTGLITGVFHAMMSDSGVDRKKPAVEWYKNEEEMWCMLKTIKM